MQVTVEPMRSVQSSQAVRNETPPVSTSLSVLPASPQAPAPPREVERTTAELVGQAIQDSDYELLRELAARPGGFGTRELRKRAWCVNLASLAVCPRDDRKASHWACAHTGRYYCTVKTRQRTASRERARATGTRFLRETTSDRSDSTSTGASSTFLTASLYTRRLSNAQLTISRCRRSR